MKNLLRPVQKIVDNSIYSKPNTHILTPFHRQSFLCTKNEPHIDYLHSSRNYVLTLGIIKEELNNPELLNKWMLKSLGNLFYKIYLKQNTTYRVNMIKFAEKMNLTAESIGNLYYCADHFSLQSNWLQTYILPCIIHQIKNMSNKNLKDIIKGVQKYHPNHKILIILKDTLKIKQAITPEIIVEYMNTNTGKYLYCETIQPSNESWIKAAKNNKGFWNVVINIIKNLVLFGLKLPLHSSEV